MPAISRPTCTETPHEADEGADPELRKIAEQRVFWRTDQAPPGASPQAWHRVKILAVNDFHGQLSSGKKVGNRPVGSAAVLASYLKAAQQGAEDRTIILHAGDHVGASPPVSALLQDEPSVTIMNMLGNEYCSPAERMNPRCNLVAMSGNHEFDEGRDEMLRLLYGGNHPKGPFLENPYTGAHFPYVSANVVDSDTGKLILPPYVIKKIQGMPIAFIGAVLKETPSIVTASDVSGLTFLDEADSINRYIPELRAKHVRTIIALIHQGGYQAATDAGTTTANNVVTGTITNIVNRLDDEVDVVASGHAHSFTNAILKNKNGKEILVTQAFSAGTAYADIDLSIDPATKDVGEKSATIVTTWADAGPGLTPDPGIAAYVSRAEEMVAPRVNRVVGTAAGNITRTRNPSGESALGNLIADAQRSALAADFAFMNQGGIRADLDAGPVTWGELFTVQPFANYLVRITLTGQQVYDLLEQQWLGRTSPRMFQVSGLAYTWDAARPAGSRIVEVRKDGMAIDRTAEYTAAVNSFLAGGGDNFTALAGGTDKVFWPADLDTLIGYIQDLPQPFSSSIEERIIRRNCERR
jgi:5'-nucleotidase